MDVPPTMCGALPPDDESPIVGLDRMAGQSQIEDVLRSMSANMAANIVRDRIESIPPPVTFAFTFVMAYLRETKPSGGYVKEDGDMYDVGGARPCPSIEAAASMAADLLYEFFSAHANACGAARATDQAVTREAESKKGKAREAKRKKDE